MHSKKEHNTLILIIINLYLVFVFIILSPFLLFNQFQHKKNKKHNPVAKSILVNILDHHPLLYELSIIVWNFPILKNIYKPIVARGELLQVGCGTGLFNKYHKNKCDNLDIKPLYLVRDKIIIFKAFKRVSIKFLFY